jgi:hypothetical protein
MWIIYKSTAYLYPLLIIGSRNVTFNNDLDYSVIQTFIIPICYVFRESYA